MASMSDSTLKSIVEAKLNNSLGWLGGTLSKERQVAMEYYRGDLFGNEQDGRSKVVSRDVAEAIDSVMPGLIKVFASTDTIIVAQPRNPQDEEVAQQSTDYLNWIFQSQPNAFDLLQTWIKDGLLAKLGVVKSYWDEAHDVTSEEYEGLTKFQYLTLLSDEDVEPVELTSTPAPHPEIDPSNHAQMPIPGQPMALGQQPDPSGMMDDGFLYDCKIRRTNKTGRIIIQAIPPEEFLTDKRAVSLEDATFAAHRSRRTTSDLIEMGYPKSLIDTLPGGDDLEFNSEKLTRFQDEDVAGANQGDDELDDSMRGVWVAECYLKVDFDGDGIAEWRKVMMAGASGYKILENEDCDGHPFSAWTPNKIPHKLMGESLADKTMDIQLIKSTVWRQTLDGMYFNNAPQLIVIEGQANMEDVLTRRPGGVIRARSVDAVTPIAVQDVSAPGMAMINYLDSVREARTGVRRFSSGLEADALNPYESTATGANLMDDASQDRVMLLARNFAEQGLKPLFSRLLELSIKYQDKAQVVRLRGKWVEIDPSTWTTKMDMTVAVGLGTGNRDRQTGQLIAMLTQIDQPIIQMQGGLNGPLLTAQNIYAKLDKLTEASGWKAGNSFYTDPSTLPPQQPAPPPPDPTMQLAQAQIAVDQQKAQAKIESDRQDAVNKAQLAQQKAHQDADLAQQKLNHDMQLAQQKQGHELELANQKAAQQAALEQQKVEHQNDLALIQHAGQLGNMSHGAP